MSLKNFDFKKYLLFENMIIKYKIYFKGKNY